MFYVDQTGQQGSICSAIDLNNLEWSNVTLTEIGVTAQSNWNGQSNTTAIIEQSEHISSAAKLCDEYSNVDYGTGVFSDWYLPAISELILIYNAKYQIEKILENDNNSATIAFVRYPYWSSNEYIINGAVALQFLNGKYFLIKRKVLTSYVRFEHFNQIQFQIMLPQFKPI